MSHAAARHSSLDLPTGPATYRLWRRIDVQAFAWMKDRRQHAQHALAWAQHEHRHVKLRAFDFALDRYELVVVGPRGTVDRMVDAFELQLQGIAAVLSPKANGCLVGARRVQALPTSACAKRVLDRIAARQTLRARNLDLDGAHWDLRI